MTISTSAYEFQLKGCIRLTKLAGMYFRNCSRAELARRMFITAIEEDKELHSRLKLTGFSFDNEIIKPKQVTLIINYWGYPDDFMINGHRKENSAHETNV
jgi:hypothetical protein